MLNVVTWILALKIFIFDFFVISLSNSGMCWQVKTWNGAIWLPTSFPSWRSKKRHIYCTINFIHLLSRSGFSRCSYTYWSLTHLGCIWFIPLISSKLPHSCNCPKVWIKWFQCATVASVFRVTIFTSKIT